MGRKKTFTTEILALSKTMPPVLTTNATKTERFVVKHVSSCGVEDDNHPIFQVKWYAYPSTESRWEPAKNNEYNTLAGYCHGEKAPVADESLWGSGISLDN